MSKKSYYRIAKESKSFTQYLEDLVSEKTPKIIKNNACSVSRNEDDVVEITERQHDSDSSESEASIINSESDCSNDSAQYISNAELNTISQGLNTSSASLIEGSDIIQSEPPSLTDQLKMWYNEYNVSLDAFRGILKIFHPFHPELPLDPRTILKTKSSNIESVANGEFIYFGLENGIRNNIRFQVSEVDKIKIDTNIDGVPVFKSRNTSFWPILCSVDNSVPYEFNSVTPFIVALFYGNKKPDVHQFLQQFVAELKSLLESGIEIGGKHFDVELRSVIADAPARAFLKQTKCHGGYYACDRCNTKGKYKNRALSYDEIDAEKRDNISFRAKSQPEHHIGTSPFTILNVDMVSVFVYDYLHVILLGIVRKMMLFWNKVPHKLSSSQKSIVNHTVKILHTYFPCDFARKPRSFEELERFKGSEFRTILLYTGFILFSDILPSKVYNNFCILIFIVRILCDPVLIDDENNLNYAQELTVSFVKQFQKIYRDINVSFNVHSLIHITDDVRKYGILDSFSAFPYESVLGNIKRKIRTSNAPLAQISRRISEGYQFKKTELIKNKRGMIIKGHMIIPNDFKNSFVMLSDRSVASVKKISGTSLEVYKYRAMKPALKYPTCSSLLDMQFISISSQSRSKICVIQKSEILRKCIILPHKKNFVIIPLL